MKWVRRHIKAGARLALLALAVQFVLSFGHFHPIAAQAAPAVETTLAQTDLGHTGSPATHAPSEAARKQLPSSHDNDHHPGDGCAICAVLVLANTALFATPPMLLLPQAIELFHLTTEAGFAHLNAVHPAFRSRAPPLS